MREVQRRRAHEGSRQCPREGSLEVHSVAEVHPSCWSVRPHQLEVQSVAEVHPSCWSVSPPQFEVHSVAEVHRGWERGAATHTARGS